MCLVMHEKTKILWSSLNDSSSALRSFCIFADLSLDVTFFGHWLKTFLVDGFLQTLILFYLIMR